MAQVKYSKHFLSKKFTVAFIGVASVLFVFTASLISVMRFPQSAAQIVNLANVTIVFLGAVSGAMLTGQSFVEWKHGSDFTGEVK